MFELLLALFINFVLSPSVTAYEIHTRPVTVAENVYMKNNSDTVINTIPSPSPTPSPDITNSPVPEATVAVPATPTPEPVKEDIEMNYIEELTKLGYLKNDYADNSVNIRNAVLKFQADSNLDADGIYGPMTTASLKKRIKDTNFAYTDVVSSPPTDNYWIYINKTRKILTLYKGSTVVHKYPVAVGNPPSLTPEGHFKILVKVVNPAWGGGGYAEPIQGGVPENPLGYRWMGLDLGGGGEYGIHGNNAPYSIGTYASHGCIRMINSDVESLYEIVPEGTPVWIGSDLLLVKDGISQPEY